MRLRGLRLRVEACVLLAAVLLAGCSAPEDARAPSPGPTTDLASSGPATASYELFTPDRLVETPLAATVEPRWVRPGEAMNATALSGLPVDRFVASRNPIRTDLPATLEGRARAGSAVAFALDQPGRHLFAIGAMGRIDAENVTFAMGIVPGLPPTTVLVVAREENDAWTLTPQAARGGPGSRISIEDRGAADLAIERIDVETFVATGANVSFAMPAGLEMGDYDVVAVAVDETRALTSATRVIYDRRKPDADWEAGPFTGSFESAANAQPTRHDWEARHAAIGVDVTVSVSSSLPVPAAARVALVDANGTELAAGSAPGFTIDRVPKGSHAFVVTAEEGVLVAYELAARGRWDLVPPASFFNV